MFKMFTIIQDYDRTCWLLFSLYLATGAVIDLRSQSVPRWWLAAGACLTGLLLIYPVTGVLGTLDPEPGRWTFRAAGALFGGLFVLVSVAKPESFGKADGILIVMTGVLIGLQRMTDMLVIAFFLASVCGAACYLIRRRRESTLPFIPFLTVGFLVGGVIRLW